MLENSKYKRKGTSVMSSLRTLQASVDRISATSSPSKDNIQTSPIKRRGLRTPDKNSPKTDKDPLRRLKIDDTISAFLSDVAKQPAVRNIQKKVFEAFDRIPNCIKDKFPGYDKKTYAKVKYYKSKLKSVINTKANFISKQVTESHEQKNDSNETNASESLMEDYNDLDNLDLETSQICDKNTTADKYNFPETSTPDFAKFNKAGPSKTIYSDLMAKKSISFDAFSPGSDSKNDVSNQSDSALDNDSVNKSKGKFVFKKPSRLTIDENNTPVRDIQSNIAERIRNATEKLKPITLQDSPKYTPMANSSVEFQPSQLSQNSVMNYNKPCSLVSPIVKDPIPDDVDDPDHIIPIDIDDTDLLPTTSNVMNLSDSISNNSSIELINNKEILVNDDGWPEYRIEDFEDDIEILTCKNSKEINLMEQSVVENDGKAKYEGMGDFAAGTQNDGITGEFDGKDYPHSSLMMEMFIEKFGLKSFRPNQLQIPAAHLSGDISVATTDEIYLKLSMREPPLKLLYVTPEKVSNSPKFQSMLDMLYSRGKISSFNRPNLVYTILEKKPKSVNQDIINIIKERFIRDSGIVYCLSRKECENLSDDLRKAGVNAAPYHAGLPDKKRETIQSGWVADKFKVADVRYVIHHSMPKSVEGYYQEAGRAGRDGERAHCLLYYSYADVMERNASPEAKRVHIENLLRMVEVCESVGECRRAQVLAYLGERFDRELCRKDKRTACDNCLNSQEYKPVDVTEDCKVIVRCIRGMNSNTRAAFTLLHIADALKGYTKQFETPYKTSKILTKTPVLHDDHLNCTINLL
ncbi:Bloom syndrome protein-like protein [Operophtera brumata]|uniref:DNA 3'-5' helicase n=1 Tax=Operophtera brumata TaxID=104452 RepID=A0A0L7L0A4_OPEBR|nr:Bloom syndrome protein-like protein [Operophtera brumata]